MIHDELDIPYGDLRAKFGGGDNGHNGLRSIRQSLGHRGLLSGPGRDRPAAGAAGQCRLRAQAVRGRRAARARPARPAGRRLCRVAARQGPATDAEPVQLLTGRPTDRRENLPSRWAKSREMRELVIFSKKALYASRTGQGVAEGVLGHRRRSVPVLGGT